MALLASKCVLSQKFLPEISRVTVPSIQKCIICVNPLKKYCVSTEKTVKSAVVKEVNQPLVIETSKKSTKLKAGQVRIGIHYCAVNVSDHLSSTGQSETKLNLPFVPGFEVSGEILEIGTKTKNSEDSDGEEDELKVGDRVLALNKKYLHGFSTECISDQQDVFPIPSSINYQTAAALGDSYGTAMLGIARRGTVKQGETVLVTAAAGGLGLAAVDIAANIYKAKVIGICGTEDKSTLVRDKGAWAAFSFKSDKILKDEVAKISNGKGANLIFEAIGGDVFKSAMECVAPEGKVIIAGFTSRDTPQLSLEDMLHLPSFSLIGVSLLNYRNKMLSVYRRTIFDVIESCEQGLISPVISEVFPLENVNEALDCLSQRKTTGKVILEIVKI